MDGHHPASNKLLAALPGDEHAQLAAHLHIVSAKSIKALCRHGHPIHHVYFPGGGAFSLERVSEDGYVAEVGMVGSEGVIGGEVFYGTKESPVDCRSLTSDVPVYAMTAAVFRRHVERRGAFYNLIVRYQQSLMSQIGQMLACSSLHSAKQRTCRWLLMVHDRAACDVIPIDERRLAEVLGSRLPQVAKAVSVLNASGAIAVRESGIAIIDRDAIAAASCECYHTMRSSFERLLPEIGGPQSEHAVGYKTLA